MENILQADDIRKEFGTLVALNNVSLSLEPGQVLGLIGPNGAGKTTLLKILATVLKPTSGDIEMLGYNSETEYLKIRKRIGYMPDFFNLYKDLTLRECLDFFARAYRVRRRSRRDRITEVLRYVELEDKKNKFVRHLSRGMMQRLGVAALLVHDPDVFLLDEPASGLDPKARIQLRQVLRKLSEEGKTIIISSHILMELSGLCTHIALMDKGKIITQGTIDEIHRRAQSSNVIHIFVLDDCDRAKTLLEQYPNVEIESVQDNEITIRTTIEKSEIARLNSHLVSQGINVYGFYEKKVDLEDLFMKISEQL